MCLAFNLVEISLNNIYFMKFQHTIIPICILKQCSMGFRNKLSNLCKSVSLIVEIRIPKKFSVRVLILISFHGLSMVFWKFKLEPLCIPMDILELENMSIWNLTCIPWGLETRLEWRYRQDFFGIIISEITCPEVQSPWRVQPHDDLKNVELHTIYRGGSRGNPSP